MKNSESAYLWSLWAMAVAYPEGLTVEEIAAKLKRQGWQGEALYPETIEQALSEIAVKLIRES